MNDEECQYDGVLGIFHFVDDSIVIAGVVELLSENEYAKHDNYEEIPDEPHQGFLAFMPSRQLSWHNSCSNKFFSGFV